MTRHETFDDSENAAAVRHFDVLIVGAGISGVGSAYHMTQQRPDDTFVVLETQESFGGTWLTHKYPGIRSDSDLYTFGYRFKPWVGAPIATAAEIRKYMGEVIEENGLDRNIRYGRTIRSAAWSSQDNQWTLEVVRAADAGVEHYSCGFLWMCQGYYNHTKPYTPEWEGMAEYKGRIVHPQLWPEDLDYTGKKVLIIGSGATAATAAPAMAGTAGHVTMLQRSPTWFIPGRNVNELADMLRPLGIDPAWIHEIVRKKVLFDQEELTRRCREDTDGITAELLGAVRAFLGEDYDVGRHFTPRYRPWRQRIAFVPDGDLFQAIAQGKLTMVTDEIDRFTEKGVRLQSGEEIEADIIVTATGFDLSVMGEIAFYLDGAPLDWSQTVTYRGMMFTGVPNLVWVFGYFRASWTLRADMVADFVCRLLGHMDARQARRVVPQLRPEDADMPLQPWIDTEDFNPNYMLRGLDKLPRSGPKPEWRHTQDYWVEKDVFPAIDLEDAAFQYS